MIIRDFQKMYCINLPRRADRRQHAQLVFKNFNFNVNFVDAVDGRTLSNTGDIKPGEAGCCLSHRKVRDDTGRFIYKNCSNNGR